MSKRPSLRYRFGKRLGSATITKTARTSKSATGYDAVVMDRWADVSNQLSLGTENLDKIMLDKIMSIGQREHELPLIFAKKKDRAKSLFIDWGIRYYCR